MLTTHTLIIRSDPSGKQNAIFKVYLRAFQHLDLAICTDNQDFSDLMHTKKNPALPHIFKDIEQVLRKFRAPAMRERRFSLSRYK